MVFHDLIDRVTKRREADKQRFDEIDGDHCMLCGAYGADKRNLRIDCLYDVSEVIPEAIDMFLVDKSGWYLRICKTCRGKLLGHLREWRDERVALRETPKDHDGYPLDDDESANIPVRVNGMIVMMTDEQYAEYRQRHESRPL